MFFFFSFLFHAHALLFGVLWILQCSLTHIFSVSMKYTVRIFNNSKETSTINSVLCGCVDFGRTFERIFVDACCRCVYTGTVSHFLEYHKSIIPFHQHSWCMRWNSSMSIYKLVFVVRHTTKTNRLSSETTQNPIHKHTYTGIERTIPPSGHRI